MTVVIRIKTNIGYSGNKDVIMITKKTMVALATIGAVSLLTGAGICSAETQTEFQTSITNHNDDGIYANGVDLKFAGAPVPQISINVSGKRQPIEGETNPPGLAGLYFENAHVNTEFGTLGLIQAKGRVSINTTGVSGGNDSGIRAEGGYKANDGKTEAHRTWVKVEAGDVNITSNDAALRAYSWSGIDIRAGSVELTADNVIRAGGGSVVRINAERIRLNGDIVISFTDDQFTADSRALADINLTLSGRDSYWKGLSYIDGFEVSAPIEPFEESSKVNLTLANGAVWEPTEMQTSPTKVGRNIGLLKLYNGVVRLPYGTFAGVDETSGFGTIEVEVKDGGTGLFTTYGERVAGLIVRLSGVTTDNISAEDGDRLARGAVQGIDSAKLLTVIPEGFYHGTVTVDDSGRVTQKVNSVMRDTVRHSSGSVVVLNRFLMNDVRKRLGDLRYAGDDTDNGGWVRYDGGRMSSSGVSNKFNTLQMGYDRLVDDRNFRAGVAASYTRSDGEITRGGSDTDAYSFALYGTWIADNGMFADVIARVASFKNELTVDTAKGDLNNTAYALSAEFGRRFDVAGNFFVEPQAELSYTYVGSAKMNLGGGAAKYRYDSADSLIGRAGAVVGWVSPDDKGQLYIRASAVHEFMGDAKVSGGGVSYTEDGRDTWAEYGLGAQFNVSGNAYVWADLERTQGAQCDEDYRATVGLRIQF